MINPAVDIARKIASYYVEKHKGDYDAAALVVTRLYITQIIPNEKGESTVTIHTGRPGLLIGRRGENIDELSKYLGLKIHIVEDMMIGWLIPYKPVDVPDYEYEPFPNIPDPDDDWGDWLREPPGPKA